MGNYFKNVPINILKKVANNYKDNQVSVCANDEICVHCSMPEDKCGSLSDHDKYCLIQQEKGKRVDPIKDFYKEKQERKMRKNKRRHKRNKMKKE